MPQLQQGGVFVQVGVALAVGEKGRDASGLGFEESVLHQVLFRSVMKSKLHQHHCVRALAVVA